MKKSILSFCFLALAFFAIGQSQPQPTTYDVARKGDQPVVIKNGPDGFEEIPVTSAQLEQDFKTSQVDIQLLTEKRNRLVLVIQYDEQLEQVQEVQALRSQLIPKVRAVETQIAAANTKPAEVEVKE